MKLQSDQPGRLLMLLGVCCFVLFLLGILQSSELNSLKNKNELRRERLEDANRLVQSVSKVSSKKVKNTDLKYDSLLSLLNGCAAKGKIENRISSMVPLHDKKKQQTTVKIQIKRISMNQLLKYLNFIHATNTNVQEDRIDIKSTMVNNDFWNVNLQISSHDSAF
jgi:hypothetical protein